MTDERLPPRRRPPAPATAATQVCEPPPGAARDLPPAAGAAPAPRAAAAADAPTLTAGPGTDPSAPGAASAADAPTLRIGRRGHAPTRARQADRQGASPPAAARRGVRRAGRYLILERLGQGGMGTVFRARDPDIGRDLAIKFLHPALCAERDGRLRFLREARAAGRLSHPNIVTVHDVGEIDGRPYMAMELLAGRTLAAELASGRPLPVRDAAAIGAQLARALGYAHAHGVVHRDIKPGNIVRAPGTTAIKVTDFGIAHLESPGTEHRTRAGLVLGTPQYMSPEQAEGAPLDGRSDIFSAGIVLYEMLAGRRPFEGDGLVAVAVRIARDEPEPVERVNPRVPASLARVVARCLAKSPDERFRDGAELAEALDAVLAAIDREARERGAPRALVALRAKWAAAMALFVALVMTVTGLVLGQRQYAAMVEQAIDSGAAVTRLVAAQNALAALAEDWAAVDVAVQEAMRAGGFEALYVTDRGGIVRAAGDPARVGWRDGVPAGEPVAGREGGVAVSRRAARDGEGTVLDFRAPITFQGKRVGAVALGLSEAPLAAVARRSLGLVALLVAVTVLAAGLAAWWLADTVSRPLGTVREALSELARGRRGHRIGIRRNDEFGLLYAACDELAEALETRRGGLPDRPTTASAGVRTAGGTGDAPGTADRAGGAATDAADTAEADGGRAGEAGAAGGAGGPGAAGAAGEAAGAAGGAALPGAGRAG